MSLITEIDRTDLYKNNLTTIKNNTNTALTQNGFKTISNFAQLPKVLNDELINFKKIAKETLNGYFFTERGLPTKKTKTVMRPAFVPGYVFLKLTATYTATGTVEPIVTKEVVISISKEKEDVNLPIPLQSGKSLFWKIVPSYNYSRNEFTLDITPIYTTSNENLKIQYDEIVFLSE